MNSDKLKLLPGVYKGKLVYKIKSFSKRISYNRIKKDLVRKSFYISIVLPF